jgi:NADH-quinone oxidoreductase subunit M
LAFSAQVYYFIVFYFVYYGVILYFSNSQPEKLFILKFFSNYLLVYYLVYFISFFFLDLVTTDYGIESSMPIFVWQPQITTVGITLCLLTSYVYSILIQYYDSTLPNFDIYSFFIIVSEVAILMCFITNNFFIFYICFEFVLVPFYFIVGFWGSRINRLGAAFRLVFFTVFFSSPLMVVIFMNLVNQNFSFDFSMLGSTMITLSPEFQSFFYLACFAAFAVKIPLFPMHVWLPEAHGEAPTFGSILLAGLLLKLGGYGFFRLFCDPFSSFASEFSTSLFPIVYTISVITILYSNLVVFTQSDVKKIIAYYSIGHIGFVTLGLIAGNEEGILGAVIIILSHGLSASALFFCIGYLYEQTHTRSLLAYRGLATVAPVFSVVFFFFICANASIPGSANFIGEQLVLIGLAKYNTASLVLPLLGVLLNGISSFLFILRLLFGEVNSTCSVLKDFTNREKAVAALLLAPIVFFGFFPEYIIKIILR